MSDNDSIANKVERGIRTETTVCAGCDAEMVCIGSGPWLVCVMNPSSVIEAASVTPYCLECLTKLAMAFKLSLFAPPGVTLREWLARKSERVVVVQPGETGERGGPAR